MEALVELHYPETPLLPFKQTRLISGPVSPRRLYYCFYYVNTRIVFSLTHLKFVFLYRCIKV